MSEAATTSAATTSTGATCLVDAASGLDDTWSPRVAGRVNDVLVKVARIEGEFVWHDHPATDEAFLVLSGRLRLRVRDGAPERERTIDMEPGDFFVVPRGVEHCPVAEPGTSIALMEAAGTVNTGAAGGSLTAPVDQPL
ncbi:MAG TPA: cupin domain-containing protein [Dermatophilaceae bacterium]|nr:cupin domain-containing protein [Dermatophilaceae bacterium]